MYSTLYCTFLEYNVVPYQGSIKLYGKNVHTFSLNIIKYILCTPYMPSDSFDHVLNTLGKILVLL